MPLLGSHMSIAGGYYKAVEAGKAVGCDCVQLFTKNNNQWRAKPITQAEADRFRGALVETGVSHPLSHSSYLINLAAPGEELWAKSIEAMVVELQRAAQLGIPYVVLHPGSYTTSSEEEGLRRVAAALDVVHAKCGEVESRIALEGTAGQGSNLGYKFEHLAEIIALAREPDRLAVCLDTCHLFAAGYPLGTKEEFQATFAEFERIVGFERLVAFHLNDSVKGLGSRVDRHAHIGHGEMGLEPFRLLLGDKRFAAVPMYLETAKGENEEGEDWDVVNLRTLRGLIGKP